MGRRLEIAKFLGEDSCVGKRQHLEPDKIEIVPQESAQTFASRHMFLLELHY